MSQIKWESEEKKLMEWAFAKNYLKSKPNGTKLRRKDYPDILQHSFIMIDNRILVMAEKGNYLGEGLAGHTKFAEDEINQAFVLKIISKDNIESNPNVESAVAADLNIAGQIISRNNKDYIAYQYLGTSLPQYLSNAKLSLDSCYDLCIQIALELHAMHAGIGSKSGKAYAHNDIHAGNVVVDKEGKPHLIDFGRAEMQHASYKDIQDLLVLFYKRASKEPRRPYPLSILGEWIGDYTFVRAMRPSFNYESRKWEFKNGAHPYPLRTNAIYLFNDAEDEKVTKDATFRTISFVRYALLDPHGNYHEDVINLEGTLNKSRVSDDGGDEEQWYLDNDELQYPLLKEKIRAACDEKGYTLKTSARDEDIFNLCIHREDSITALDIAERFIASRYGLINYPVQIQQYPQPMRYKALCVLNSTLVRDAFIHLYGQLPAFNQRDNLGIDITHPIIRTLFNVSENNHQIANTTTDGASLHQLKAIIDSIKIENRPLIAESIVNHLSQYLTARSANKQQYHYYMFGVGLGKSLAQKTTAVQGLIKAINEPSTAYPINEEMLETLRNGRLGDIIRNFVRSGEAQKLLDCEDSLTTVRDFIKIINQKIERAHADNLLSQYPNKLS